jgi:hypothetical protein
VTIRQGDTVQWTKPFVELRKDTAFERASWVGSKTFVPAELHEEDETCASDSDIFLVGDCNQVDAFGIEDYKNNEFCILVLTRCDCENIDSYPAQRGERCSLQVCQLLSQD